MVVVIEGHTSKLHACESKGLALQRCLFRNDYDLGACAWYVSDLEKCCHKYQVPSAHLLYLLLASLQQLRKVASITLQHIWTSWSPPPGLPQHE